MKINSQTHEAARIDWRIDQHNIDYTRIFLPDHIYELCIDFLNSGNLRTGSFDFIVDKNNNYIFLEINTAGQFLFLDNRKSNINTLGHFALFLISNDDNIRENDVPSNVDTSAFHKSEKYHQFCKQIKTGSIQNQARIKEIAK